MQSYPDGTPFLIGDHLLIEHGRTPATIEHLIVSGEEMANLGAGRTSAHAAFSTIRQSLLAIRGNGGPRPTLRALFALGGDR